MEPTDLFPQETWDHIIDFAAADDVSTAAALRSAHSKFERALSHLYHRLVIDWANGRAFRPTTHIVTDPFRAHYWFHRHPHLCKFIRRLRLNGSPSYTLPEEAFLDLLRTFPNIDELTVWSIQTSHIPSPQPHPALRRLCLGGQPLAYTGWLAFETRFASSLQSLAFQADNTIWCRKTPMLTPPTFPLVTHLDIGLPSGKPRPVTFPHLPALTSMTLTALFHRPTKRAQGDDDSDEGTQSSIIYPSSI